MSQVPDTAAFFFSQRPLLHHSTACGKKNTLCPQTLTFERELVNLLKSNFPVGVASSVSYLSLRHCISYGLCCFTQKSGNSSCPDSSRCYRVNQCFVLFFSQKSIAPRQGKCLMLISCRCKLSCERPVHMY